MKIRHVAIVIEIITMLFIATIAYKVGVHNGLSTLRECRLKAYDSGNRAGHAEGFSSCQDQF